MKCSRIEEKIELYDLLDAREQAVVDAHVVGCAACRQQLQHAQYMQKLIREAALQKPAPDDALFLTERIMRGVTREHAGGTSRVSWLNLSAMPMLRVAYGIVSLLLVTGFIYETNRPVSVSVGPPVSIVSAAAETSLNTTTLLKHFEKPTMKSRTPSIWRCMEFCQATVDNAVCSDCKEQYLKFYAKL